MILSKPSIILVCMLAFGLLSCRVRQDYSVNSVATDEIALHEFHGIYELLNSGASEQMQYKQKPLAEVSVSGRKIVLNAHFSIKTSPLKILAKGGVFEATIDGQTISEVYRAGNASFKGLGPNYEHKSEVVSGLRGHKITQTERIYSRHFQWDDQDEWQPFETVNVSLTLYGRHLTFVRSVYNSSNAQTEYTELHFSKSL